jgi:FkbM family methyltransferase
LFVDTLLENVSTLNSEGVSSGIKASVAAGHLFAMGRNEHALALHNAIGLKGVVDDFSPLKEWQGLAVIKLEDLPEDACVVNCVFSIHSCAARKRLNHIVPDRWLTYRDLQKIYGRRVPDLSFSRAASANLKQYPAQWDKLFHMLEDEPSRAVLRDQLSFRLTGDARFMASYSLNIESQYFDPVAEIPESAIIVDGGAYDGDTAHLFLQRCPSLKEIHLFEPSPQNMVAAQRRLGENTQIYYHELALSNVCEKVRFADVGGTDSAISETGQMEVQAVTIDQSLGDRPVSFIKLDIEGGELNALKGAAQQIKRNAPILAVCVYHDIEDFWRIPDFVMGLGVKYKIYLRHYTEGWSETVMYFVPV